MNEVFYECFKVDLPTETTCYTAGSCSSNSQQHFEKRTQIAKMDGIHTIDASYIAWRISTLHHTVTLSVHGCHRNLLHATHSRYPGMKGECVAYTCLTNHSPRFYPLEAFIYQVHKEDRLISTPSDTLESNINDPVPNNKIRGRDYHNCTYLLKFCGQASSCHKSTFLSIFGDKKSELELPFTPLALHLCPLMTRKTESSRKHHNNALLLIGSMEEPFLKTFLVSLEDGLESISQDRTADDRPTLFMQEVTYNHKTYTQTIPISASLTPCFSNAVTSAAMEGNGGDCFLPSSYWDPLISSKYGSDPLDSSPNRVEKHESVLPLEVSSPVMGIHSMILENIVLEDEQVDLHHLAIACQDGTVRIVTFTIQHDVIKKSPQYHILNVSDVIIDGPIISLKLSASHSNTRTQEPPLVTLSVGSLCGTACQFVQCDPLSPFQGPEKVISTLWNYVSDMEDSVTAIESKDNTLIIGTFSGNLLVFCKGSSSGSVSDYGYTLAMEHFLQYPIHSIIIDDVDDDGTVEMMVCTRKSVHLYRKRLGFTP